MEPDARITEHYDDLAAHWADIVDSPERRDLLWPTLSGMLPDLAGRRVLDAGCGSGVYAAKLVERGADVIGIDVSDEMLREARERVPGGRFEVANVGETLDFLEDDSVDVVLCQHVFSHLRDLTVPLSEFARVLVEGGDLVVSTHNPVHDYVVVRDGEYPITEAQADLDATLHAPENAPSYTKTERFDVVWNPEAVANRATYYRRSFEQLVSPMLDAGFTLLEVTEPGADEIRRAVPSEDSDDGRPYPPESICLHATL